MKWMVSLLSVLAMAQTMPLEKARVLERALLQDLRRQAGPADNATLSEFVQRVGKRLASGADFRFELVGSSGAAEPVGVSGGTVLVPVSFFRLAENEAEFAGMLAHAMAHVALRHGWMNLPPAKEGTIPLFFVPTHQTHQMVPGAYLETARNNELEADRYGARMVTRAGYDAAAISNYVRRVQPENGPSYLPLPPKTVRLAALEEAAAPGGEIGGSEYLRLREAAGIRAPKPPSLRR